MKKYLLFYLSYLVFAVSGLQAQQTYVLPKITDSQGNENPVIDCNYPLNGNCLSLSTTYPKIFDTSTYQVSSEDYKPIVAFNEGTALNANADDLFLNKIVIPFNFCFFGQSYNEVVVGSNGMLTFNSAQLGNVNYPNIEGENPNASLPLNSIFGVAQDLVFSKNDDSEIYYSVVGSAPFRKLVINFYKAKIAGCDQTSTSQIVLSEFTNDIEIFVENKPMPCNKAKFKQSLIGIIGGDPTLGYSPPGRNTGIWSAQQEAWKFSPSGNEIMPEINWYNSDNQNIGSGISVSVCPDKTEKYVVKVAYSACGNDNLVLEDDVLVSFNENYPIIKDFTKILCGNPPFKINLDDYLANLTSQNPANLAFSFHNSLAEAQNNLNPQPKVFDLNSNKIFYVRAQNPFDPNCFRTSVLKLDLIYKSLLTSTIEICDTNNDQIERNYLLSLLTPKLFNLPLDGSVHYFKTKTDAENNQNEIINADITSNSQFFVSYKTKDCNQVFGPISINFASAPIVNSPIDFPYTTCDFRNDKTEPFDFSLFFDDLISTDPNVIIKYYSTYQDALLGNNATISTIKEGPYQVYARVEIPGGCFSIVTINLDITFKKIEAIDQSIYLCFDGSQDVAVNLDDYSNSMLINPLIGIKITYFANFEDADTNINPISNNQIISGNGNFVSGNYFVRFADETDCYAVKKLNINLVHPEIVNSDFNVCDFKNDGSENVDLSIYTKEIIGAQKATVKYFKTSEDAQQNSNPINSIIIGGTQKLYVSISSFGCVNLYPINLKLVPTPIIKEEVTAVRNSVCDNNNDNQENFDLTQLQTEIYNGAEKANFVYYTNYNPTDNSLSGLISNPKTFSVKGISTVFAKVILENGGCYSVSKINITLNFLPAIVLKTATIGKCDADFNLNESFILEDAIPLLFTQSENSISLSQINVTFFETENDANDGNVSLEIHSPYKTTDSELTVFARFTSKDTSCYSVIPLVLKSYLPPKALKSTISDICDDNLDGFYDVNLKAHQENTVVQSSADNNFSFYYTEEDAKNKANEILNSESFSANPLPQNLWVRVENIPGCYDVAPISFNLGPIVPLKNTGPIDAKICDTGNDGNETVDLSQYENEIYNASATFNYFTSVKDLNNFSNQIKSPKDYLFNENSGPKKIYVKISAAGFCPQMLEIDLSLKTTPIFSLPDYFFCPEGFVDIKPNFSNLNIARFEWKDPSGKIISTNNEILNIKNEGTYTINVVAQNGCPFSTTFQVKKYEVPVIKQLNISGNNVTVIATGSKTILYSKDGINFQLSNIFTDLPVGVTTFYVKFQDSDCAPITKKGVILDINNAFSPNGDGFNDTWIIKDLYVFDGQKANLKVFDRFQKLIFEQESNTSFIWDGKTNKRGVSTDSYWYVISLPDGRVINGWVLLKNRN